MIGKGTSISHTGTALAYAQEKLHAQELDRALVAGSTPKEIEREFRVLQDQNTNCQKNTLAFVLSPTVADGWRLRPEDWVDLSRAFVDRMGLTDHQYVSYLHRDRDHQHLHLYVNRIGFEGKAFDDAFLSNRSARIAEQLAQELGLTTAKQVQQQKQAEKKHIKEAVLEAHRAVLSDGPLGMPDYAARMRERGLEVHLKRNEAGKLIGVQYGAGGELIKASDVHRSLTANRLEQTLSEAKKQVRQGQEATPTQKISPKQEITPPPPTQQPTQRPSYGKSQRKGPGFSL